MHQLQLVSLSLSFSIAFSVLLQGQGPYLSFRLLSVSPSDLSPIWQVLFFLPSLSGGLAEVRWSVCMSKSHRNLCVSFSRTDSGLCIYQLFVWSNLNFLCNSQWITFPTQRVYIYIYILVVLAHWICLFMWLVVSSLTPHKIIQIFSCVLSILLLLVLLLLQLLLLPQILWLLLLLDT